MEEPAGTIRRAWWWASRKKAVGVQAMSRSLVVEHYPCNRIVADITLTSPLPSRERYMNLDALRRWERAG
jgi:hypothetical protein